MGVNHHEQQVILSKTKKRKWLSAVCFLMLFLLAACSAEEVPAAAEPIPTPAPIVAEKVEPTPSPTPSPEPTPEPVEPVYAYTYPLTGMGTDKPTVERPIMVMIENSAAARPQTGLDQADIVYEILAEGDITRFAAIYQSQYPSLIGPVRSIRPYYISIGEGHGAIVAHAGGSPDAKDILANKKMNLDQITGDHVYFWRDNSRKAPHNLFTSVMKLREGAAAKKYDMKWAGPAVLFADKNASFIGDSAREVSVAYYQNYEVSYEYDPVNNIYIRSMAGKPHDDAVTGKTLTATNIFILESKHKVLDSEGRREVDINGPGKGFIVQQGMYKAITWQRNNGIIEVSDKGQVEKLQPGQTWIQFIPEGFKTAFE